MFLDTCTGHNAFWISLHLSLCTILSIVLSIISPLFLFTTSSLRTEDLIHEVLSLCNLVSTLKCLVSSDSHSDRHCLVPHAWISKHCRRRAGYRTEIYFSRIYAFIMINGWSETICSAFIITNNIESNLTPTVLSFFNNTIQWQKGYEILCRDLYLSWTGWNIDNGNSLGWHWYNRKQHMTCSSEQCAVTTNYIPIHTQHIKSLFVSLLLWALYLWLLYHLK